MRQGLCLLASLALAGCATHGSQPYDPVETVAYSALGHDPFWLLTIGDDRIILTLGDEGGRADGALESYSWPRALPRIAGGLRTWEAAGETAAITIESRPGPCEGSAGHVYEDHVRVRLSGRELAGCGGRAVGSARPTAELLVASGERPHWFLTLDRARIRLVIGHAQRHQETPLEVHDFATPTPRNTRKSRIWSIPSRGQRLTIEARREPCGLEGHGAEAQAVRVRLGDREFAGCWSLAELVRG